MKKTLTIVFVAALMAGFWSGCKNDDGGGNGEADKTESKANVEINSDRAIAKAQALCPIGGDAIDKASFADFKGERVYFCCNGCKPKFEKDAENIVAKMKEDGIELASSTN